MADRAVPGTIAAALPASTESRVRDAALLLLCAAMMLVEGFDLAAMPLVVPIASAGWGLSPAQFAWSLSAVIAGVGVAAIALAPLGDRYGRRRTIVASGLMLVVVTTATATATGPTGFAVWRFLTGLALGACLPNTTALAAEIAPARLRARILTLITAAVPLGSVLAGLSAGALAQWGGWHAFFLVAGAITVAAVVPFAALLPRDSLRVPATSDRAGRARTLPVLRPLVPPHRHATLALLALGTCNTFLIYMLISWLPTLLPRTGSSLATAAKLSTLVQVGGLLGGLAYSWFIDNGYARRTFLVGYVVAITALLLLAGAPGTAASALLLLLIGVGISGAHTTITIYGIGFFPAALVSSFLGLSIAVTRVGAIGGPLAGGALVAQGGIAPFALVAAAVALACLICVLLVPHAHTDRRALQR